MKQSVLKKNLDKLKTHYIRVPMYMWINNKHCGNVYDVLNKQITIIQ